MRRSSPRPRTSRWLYAAALAAVVVSAPLGGDASASAADAPDTPDAMPAPGERAIEGRLLAPCCWDQTLDVHESELARELRREIRARIHRGETADAVERDLVERYGERIRALPSPVPLKIAAVGMMIGIALAGLGTAFLLGKWRRAGENLSQSSGVPGAVGRDDYDDLLDEQLRDLDA